MAVSPASFARNPWGVGVVQLADAAGLIHADDQLRLTRSRYSPPLATAPEEPFRDHGVAVHRGVRREPRRLTFILLAAMRIKPVV